MFAHKAFRYTKSALKPLNELARPYPDIVKKDCVVLDFGTSTLLHGSLEQDVNLDDQVGEGEAPTKECPECGAEVPAAVKECPLCGYEWQQQAAQRESSGSFVMSEIDLLKRSSFLWVDLQGNDKHYLATGFSLLERMRPPIPKQKAFRIAGRSGNTTPPPAIVFP